MKQALPLWLLIGAALVLIGCGNMTRTPKQEPSEPKATPSQPKSTPQDLINKAADAVKLTVANKTTITADALTENNITASGFDAKVYSITYADITRRNKQKEAAITFQLVQGTLHSKKRTITITGFKEPLAAPTPHGTVSVRADELLPVFELQKGTMTASAAAKKAAEKSGLKIGAFYFDFVTAVTYDDKDGSFTLKLTGKKDGAVFDQTVSFTGFPHPLAGKHLQAFVGSSLTLNFAEAIERNYSLEKYITEMNKDASGATFLTPYSFTLDDAAHTVVSYGSGAREYTLTARLSAAGTDTVKVTPVFALVYYKKTADAAETVETIPDSVVPPTHTVRYFTEDDVFKHILSTLNNDFIKQNSTIFASSLSAPAIDLKTTPADLFDLAQIQSYRDTYNEKSSDEHLLIKNITAAIYKAADGGITARDGEGTLTVNCCISTEEKIAENNNSSNHEPPPITAIKELSRADFKKADAETLKAMFAFKILKAEGKTAEEAKNKWKRIPVPLSGGASYRLLSGKDGGYKVFGLPPMSGMPFSMTINDGDTPADVFACGTGHLSKSTDGSAILLEGVMLKKEAGEEDLQVTFVLSDGLHVPVTYKPSIH